MIKPFVVLTPETKATEVVERLRAVPGVVGAAAPSCWRKGGYALVEAIPAADGSSKAVRGTISRVKDALPAGATLGGVAPEDRDFVHALFEVAADVLKRARDGKPNSIIDAVKSTNLNTIVGHISWKGGPVPNVAKTKLAGAQWRKSKRFKYELVVVSSKRVPGLERQGKLVPIPYT